MIGFLAPALVFMAAVFLVPLGFIVLTSFGEGNPSLAAYAELGRPLYRGVLWNTLSIAALSTAVTALIGYPIAYHLSRQPPRRRALLAIMVLLPLWTSILVKSFAFTVLLGQNGIVNAVMTGLFGPAGGLKLLFNRPGVIIGMSHYLLPFMVFSILASLLNQNPELKRAAEVMGAGPLRIFLKLTLPLSLPGLMAGVLLSMIMSMGMFVTPALLGGRGDLMISNLVDFHVRETLDWNIASALAVGLVFVTGILALGLARVRGSGLLGGEA